MDEVTTTSDMIPCPDCGRMVPIMNIQIHLAHACSSNNTGNQIHNNNQSNLQHQQQHIHNRPSSPTPVSAVASLNNTISVPDTPPPRSAVNRQHLTIDDDDDDDDDDDRKLPAATTTRRSNNTIDLTESPARVSQVVNLLDNDDSDDNDDSSYYDSDVSMEDVARVIDPPAASAVAATAATTDAVENHDEWACPRCTLLNFKTTLRCSACNGPRPGSSLNNNDNSNDDIRQPDAVRRERLLSPDNGRYYYDSNNSNTSSSSPFGYVSGGALFGGALSVAGAYLQGRPLTSSLMEGAISGAVSGAVLQEVMVNNNNHAATDQRRIQQQQMQHHHQQHQQQQHQQQQQQHQQRQTRNINNNSPYRSSYSRRVVVRRGPNGTMVTTMDNGGGSDSDLLEYIMLRNSLMHRGIGFPGVGGIGGNNIDNMSYEELLERFGDGSENLGANDNDIHQLPESIITDPMKELPEDHRQCLICLEDYETNDIRKTLPCLHGFHKRCLIKWLKTNGSCPICKHNIRS